MLRRSTLLSIAIAASLASAAASLPRPERPERTRPTVDDPIACPYCGGGATLETLIADLGVRITMRTGKILAGY